MKRFKCQNDESVNDEEDAKRTACGSVKKGKPKHTVSDENREFNIDWEEQFFYLFVAITELFV